mgnify:CR=1 FL=1
MMPGIIEQNPDMILIYAGHNEYYGALGAGSLESLGNSRWLVNQMLAANKYKTVQLLRNTIKTAKERHDMFLSIFEEKCQTMYIQKKSFSSFHVVALFKNKGSVVEEDTIIQTLKKQHITVFSLSKCYVGKPQKLGLILKKVSKVDFRMGWGVCLKL